jgi:O-antigen ligase
VGEGTSKGIIVAAIALIVPLVVYFAYTSPGYFTSQTYLGGLLLLELLIAAISMYRRVYFPLVIVAFLLAGVDLPISSVFTAGRWAVLAVGAAVGSAIMLKDRRHPFNLFHVLGLLAVLGALASAGASRYSSVSFLKVLSLLLLFLYGATGARLAVTDRENRFFSGLLIGCEILVAVIAALYLSGIEVLGNPNSLGAVMGVVAAPVLLWGMLLDQDRFSRRRRSLLFALSMYLTYSSHARAGLLAVFVSCAVMCLALRRFRLLAQGIGIIAVLTATSAIVQPEAFSRTLDSITSTVVYKGKPGEGLLSSRESPWQDTLDAIHDHFWFGTGFGTSDKGGDSTVEVGRFSTTAATSAEHGSSYLAIIAWVGVLGIIPFFLLLGTLVSKIGQTIFWMVKTGNPSHPAVPLAMVLLAGLVHGAFEDWMFAPGYYLCVFFWSIAFIFVDQVKSLSMADVLGMLVWRVRARQGIGALAPTR